MKKLSVSVVILLFLFGCSKQQEVLNLHEELEFAQVKEDFFINDYLLDDAQIHLKDGWSKLRKKGYRAGVYPRSVINFFLFQKRPVYLFFKCKPTRKDPYAAQKIAIVVNGSNVAEEELDIKRPQSLKVSVPNLLLNEGQNTLEFVYQTTKSSKNDFLSGEKDKHVFSVVFHRLILSSISNMSEIEKIVQKQRFLLAQRGNSFVQRIPGEIDFFLRVPSDAVFRANCEFIWLDPEVPHEKTWKVRVNVKQPGEKEQTLDQTYLGRKENKKVFRVDLSSYRKPVRLRLQVEEDVKNTRPKGLLIWSEARILAKKSKFNEKKKEGKELERARKLLQNNNTIIIIFDAARADHSSTYGYTRPTTPNVDQFAREGIIFQNAFSEALTTRASIGSLFTGYHLEVIGFKDIFSRLPDNFKTLAQLFKDKGYKTAGFTGVGNISSEFGFDRGFDEYFDLFREKEFRRKSQQYIPYVFPWLEQNKEKNFFLYIHFKEPHAVYIPQPPFRGMFSAAYAQKTDLGSYIGKEKDLTEEQVEYIRACYDENLASVDSVFGKLIQKLKDLDLLEKTNIILLSDHGDMLGEKERVFGHGRSFGDGGIHIPLIIRFPKTSGIDAPQRIDAIVKTSDVFMFLVDVFQFDVGEELVVGRSFFPLFFDKKIQINSYVVTGRQGIKEYSLRAPGKKLIYFEQSEKIEFYNLTEDPLEANEVYSLSNIEANFLWVELKRWLRKQRFIRYALFDKKGQEQFEGKKIDEKTIENLKALGYIK